MGGTGEKYIADALLDPFLCRTSGWSSEGTAWRYRLVADGQMGPTADVISKTSRQIVFITYKYTKKMNM